MIEIKNKIDCCGCSACQQICPKSSITMQEDEQGFLYPIADLTTCIDCHLCEKVCPVLNRYESSRQPTSYACVNKDIECVQTSSSGGFYTVLAEHVLDQGGVVFGVRFDDEWSAVFDFTESKDELSFFRGSKYTQPIMGDIYQRVKEFLINERKVLFAGTSCQISGLNHFLRKKYDNLITVDIVCHSIPNPKIWRMYLQSVVRDKKISSITFRDKSLGWRNYALRITATDESESEKVIIHEGKDQNLYMRGFLNDLYTRPSCSNCPARNYTSGSDLMIADFWGVEKYHPEIDTNMGISLVLTKTTKGETLLSDISSRLSVFQVPYDEVEDKGLHRPITASSKPHRYRQAFYRELNNDNLLSLIQTCLDKQERYEHRIDTLKGFAKMLGIRKILKMIYHG